MNVEWITRETDIITSACFIFIALTMIYTALHRPGLPFCRFLFCYGGFILLRSAVVGLSACDFMIGGYSLQPALIPIRIVSAALSCGLAIVAPVLLIRMVAATETLKRNADINLVSIPHWFD